MKKNIRFYILFLIFILPVIASSYVYYFHDSFKFKTTNHGTLVTPPYSIKSNWLALKKWHIVYLPESCADHQCEKMQHTLQQLQKALGKNRDRVVLVFSVKQWEFNIKHGIFLIDPMGNIFMYYPSNIDPMFILTDLKHVLEVSQIG